jgi:hypothetical protein
MVNATLEDINAEILKYQALAEGVGDTRIDETSKIDGFKVTSNKLVFEEENVFLALTFNSNIKKISCVFYLTYIDDDFVDVQISKVGLAASEKNIENYRRDPSLIDRYWEKHYIPKYKEIFKYLRRSKVKYRFVEKMPPTLKKNRMNEVVYE